MITDTTRGNLDYHWVNWRNTESTGVLPQSQKQCGGGLFPVLGGLRLVRIVCIRMVHGNLGSVSRDACWPQLLFYGYVSNSVKGYYPDLKICCIVETDWYN